MARERQYTVVIEGGPLSGMAFYVVMGSPPPVKLWGPDLSDRMPGVYLLVDQRENPLRYRLRTRVADKVRMAKWLMRKAERERAAPRGTPRSAP